MVSFDCVKEKDVMKLKKHGYSVELCKSQHEALRLKGPVTAILYKTGKLLLQGNSELVDEAARLADYLGITTEKRGYCGLSIGSDEALKGDTFGGLVVAGFKADDKVRDELKQMGVKDSKQLLKPDIVRIAKQLIAKFPGNFHVENIFPKEYNKMNIKSNVTEIMDTLHARCYKKLAGRKKVIHIVDLYPGCKVGNIKVAKAESKYLEVAAASIIARYHALVQIKELESRAGFFIPLGSTHVDAALLELRKKSLKKEDFVKVKFKNVVAFFA